MMPTYRPTTTCGTLLAAACILLMGCQMPTADADSSTFDAATARERAADELLDQHGAAHAERIQNLLSLDEGGFIVLRESDGLRHSFHRRRRLALQFLHLSQLDGLLPRRPRKPGQSQEGNGADDQRDGAHGGVARLLTAK